MHYVLPYIFGLYIINVRDCMRVLSFQSVRLLTQPALWWPRYSPSLAEKQQYAQLHRYQVVFDTHHGAGFDTCTSHETLPHIMAIVLAIVDSNDAKVVSRISRLVKLKSGR